MDLHIFCSDWVSHFSALSWWEHVIFPWDDDNDDDDVGFVQTKADLIVLSAVRHFTALGLMYSDSEQTSLCQFGLTWPRLEPTIYLSRGEYTSQCGWCGFFLMDVRLNGNHNCNNKVVCLVWRNCDSMSIPNMWGFPCLFACLIIGFLSIIYGIWTGKSYNKIDIHFILDIRDQKCM